jgi:hypothetical protein
LLIFELTTPRHEIASGQLHASVNFLLGLRDKAADVATGDIAFDHDPPLRHFPADLRGSFRT